MIHLAAGLAQDTIFVAARDTVSQVADISLIVMAVGAGAMLLVTSVLLFQMRRLLAAVNEQVKPVADRARVAAENVEYISAVVREDMQKVTGSVALMTDRLNEASRHMEDRVQDFNALMEVVQDEAERVFIDTAAVVRGVQAGAATLSGEVAGDDDEAESLEPPEAPSALPGSTDDEAETAADVAPGASPQ